MNSRTVLLSEAGLAKVLIDGGGAVVNEGAVAVRVAVAAAIRGQEKPTGLGADADELYDVLKAALCENPKVSSLVGSEETARVMGLAGVIEEHAASIVRKCIEYEDAGSLECLEEILVIAANIQTAAGDLVEEIKER